jgi:hypothetical protein
MTINLVSLFLRVASNKSLSQDEMAWQVDIEYLDIQSISSYL